MPERFEPPERGEAQPADGEPCTGHTVGLLQRRHIEVIGIAHVGKEASALDLVEAGLVEDVDEVLSTYRPDPWVVVRPVLAEMPASRILAETHTSLREIHYWKSGKHRPEGDRYSRIISSCARYSRERLGELRAPFIPAENILEIRLYAQTPIRG